MKKLLVGSVIVAILLVSLQPVSLAANPDPGGVKGFFAGCCFGLRVGVDYNEKGIGDRDFVSWFLVGACCGLRAQEDYVNGKDVHWRDWTPILPYVGVLFSLWNGVDTANGKVRSDLQNGYGVSYY